MVLVKMLMEIDPLSMIGSMVMTIVMISPSWRDVSPAEQLRRSPRLVSPGSASWRRCFVPKASSSFFPGRKTSYSQRWAPEAYQGAHEAGGGAQGGRARPPPSWMVGGPPLVLSSLSIFYIYYENNSRGVSRLLEMCRIGL